MFAGVACHTLALLPRLEPDHWIWLALIVTVGAVVGSFFNVVIYRWPLGRSIVRPPSNCPSCGKYIHARHNIPVLGWLMLRGRCYFCNTPISPRYPLIETLSALSLGLLGWLEPLGNGVNLPVDPELIDGSYEIADLFGILAFHGALLSGLLIAAGIDFDRHRVPRGLAIALILIALGVTWYRPTFLPVIAFETLPAQLQEQRGAIGVISSFYGAIAGAMLGALAAPATSLGRSGKEGSWSVLLMTTCVGAFLGWQAVGTITAVCAIAFALVVVLRHGITPMKNITFLMLLWLGTLVWLAAWSWFQARIMTALASPADLPVGTVQLHLVKLLIAQGLIVTAMSTIAYLLRGPALTVSKSTAPTNQTS